MNISSKDLLGTKEVFHKMFCAKEDLCIRRFEYFTQLHIQFEVYAAINLVFHFFKTP